MDSGRWPYVDIEDPSQAAAAFCSACLEPFSGRSLSVRDDGRAICMSCARALELDVRAPADAAVEDPVLVDGWRHAVGYVAVRAHEVLAKPYRGSIMPSVRFGYAMTVAGIAMWLGWALLLHREALVDEFMAVIAEQGQEVTENTAVLTLWLAVPFLAALRMVLGSAAFHLGVRLAGAPRETLHEHLRLFALTSASLVFCVIPEFGPLIAMVIWLSSTLAYLRTRYGFGIWRGLASTFPTIIVVSTMWPAMLQ